MSPGIFEFTPGRLPLLVSVPHAGTCIPESIRRQLSAVATPLPDTDWFVDRLYSWVVETGVGLITANYSRYVIDLNRPPDDAALYPGKIPGLVPDRTFSGHCVYEKETPDADEVQRRITKYWQPYHQAIRAELDRMREIHGYAILFDAHSIRSAVPGLFEGKLPDLNLGSFNGQSAAPGLINTALGVFGGQNRFSHVADQRFKGGYITRHFGHPSQNLHALQLEMSQTVYMCEDPPTYDHEAAAKVQPLLELLIRRLLAWNPDSA